MVINLDTFKNDLVAQMGEALTEDAKKALLRYIQEHIMPIVQDIAIKYIDQLKVDAETESGWSKFRDAIFLPVLIECGYWVISKCLEKLIEKA